MKYISLFSGIGGFEQGIHSVFPDAECLGYSEIDKHAIKIYSQHFSSHKNLGDITKIEEKDIKKLGKCDLVVGGFPCTNLSSMANIQGNNKGLKGDKSRLFYDLVRIISYTYKNNPKIVFIIENNNSMRKKEKETITNTLEKNFGTVYNYMLDNASFGVQTRKRLIWTNFQFQKEKINCIQDWKHVLEDKKITEEYKLSDRVMNSLNKLYLSKNIKGYTFIAVKFKDKYKFEKLFNLNQKSRWHRYQQYSDTSEPKSRPILSSLGSSNNIVVDRRYNEGFLVRYFTPIEIERLFGFSDNYTNYISETRRKITLGNSIPVFIVKYILKQYKIFMNSTLDTCERLDS